MMTRYLLFLLGTLLFFPPAWAEADPYQCQQAPEVRVTAADVAATLPICAAAAAALEFLGSLELGVKQPIRIVMVHEPVMQHDYPLYGAYDPGQDVIVLMTYADIKQLPEQRRVLGEEFDRVHYAGLIAHELAHAVIEQNLKFKEATIFHEYLAYATQLAVMPEERRQQLIAGSGVEAWHSGDIISALFMSLAPGKFALKSYQHLMSLPDPAAYIRTLLQLTGAEHYLP